MLLGLPYYLIIVLPLAGSVLIPLIGRVNQGLRDWTPAIIMGVTMVFCWSLLVEIGSPTGPTSWIWIPSLGLQFEVLLDPLSVIMAVLSSTLCFLIYVYSVEYMAHEGDRDRFFFLMLAFGGGMLTLVLSNNLLIAFVGWEIMGFCSFGLIGFWNDKRNPPESEADPVVYKNPLLQFRTEGHYNTHCGTKAFMVTRFGDAFMLAGILLLFSFAGTFSFTGTGGLADPENGWFQSMASMGILVPMLVLVFLGAMGKSGQVPLQVWLPEAMAGPTSVSALIHAATMVKAGVYMTARLLLTMAGASSGGGSGEHYVPLQLYGLETVSVFFMIVAVVGALTAFMTATMGMVSNELKQILAFSTLSQLGYMMLAIGTGGLLAAHYEPALVSGVLHVVSHGAFKALLFLAAGGVIHAVHTKYVTKMGGLRRYMPRTFVVMWIGVLALSGVPPLSGFWSKDSIIEYTYELALHEPIGTILFLLSVLAAGCTVFYSVRLMGLVFYGREQLVHEDTHETVHHGSSPDSAHDSPHDPGPIMMVPLYILAAFTVIAIAVFPFIQSLLEHSGPLTPDAYLSLLYDAVAVKFSASGVVPFGATMLALLIGGVPAYAIYVRRADERPRLIPDHGPLRRLYTFLRHRWYINEFYYWVVGKFLALAEWWRVRVDNSIIDGIDMGMASAGKSISRRIRWFDDHVVDGLAEEIASSSVEASRRGQRIQTGHVNDYAAVMVFGLGLIVILGLIAMGVF
ncbi:MAG: proton-conducting transporter membrane subunit [Candidatus Thorarchaeota archaeon]